VIQHESTRAIVVRILLLGALSLCYVAGSMWLGTPRWDGYSPEPYKYVTAPPGVTNGGTPSTGSQKVALTATGSSPSQALTPDLQAQLLLDAGVFPPSGQAKDVTVTLTPEGPPGSTATVALYGNVYVLKATYSDGTAVAEPWPHKADLYLRIPTTVPDGMYLLKEGQPQPVAGSEADLATGVEVAHIDRGGRYVLGGKPGATTQVGQGAHQTTSPATSGSGTVIAAVAASAVVLVAGFIAAFFAFRQSPSSTSARNSRRR
jgi:hypothetical protein